LSDKGDQGGTDVLIQDMTRQMSINLLKSSHLGRIACAQGSQPYVVPFFFAYHESFIYSFATVGTRIEWMRANPLVCVEVERIASRHEWRTVVIFGRYQELPETPEFHGARVVAHDLLAKTAIWWEPGYVKTFHQGDERPLQPIYFRIVINQISGHQAFLNKL
jgi:nitroimidazol reductase NimA-like FMN-containing flavoprotein (pyridoxamine 5'-phosphate oxidase superfamily)